MTWEIGIPSPFTSGGLGRRSSATPTSRNISSRCGEAAIALKGCGDESTRYSLLVDRGLSHFLCERRLTIRVYRRGGLRLGTTFDTDGGTDPDDQRQRCALDRPGVAKRTRSAIAERGERCTARWQQQSGI